ncbi:MAG: anti-sigma factor [Terriglobales bacterium]|jgi:hypothetical protein
MKCTETKNLLSSYLDGAVTGKQMLGVDEHLSNCMGCRQEYALLYETQRMVSNLGRKPAPANLALRLRVALSQEAAKKRRFSWVGLQTRWQNTLDAFMVPATVGVLSAVLFFGLLIGLFALPQPLEASENDVPTSLYTAPVLRFSPSEIGMGMLNAESIVVEANIDQDGKVHSYRILSAPSDAKDYLPQLNNMLIFTVFHPATEFGQPTGGKAVLSYSKINVKG